MDSEVEFINRASQYGVLGSMLLEHGVQFLASLAYALGPQNSAMRRLMFEAHSRHRPVERAGRSVLQLHGDVKEAASFGKAGTVGTARMFLIFLLRTPSHELVACSLP